MAFINWDGAILVCIAVVFLSIVCSFFLIRRRNSLEKYTRKHFDAFSELVIDLERRLTLIQSHAVNYMHSLGPEGSKALLELRTTINGASLLADEVARLLATHRYGPIAEAQMLLNGEHPAQLYPVQNRNGSVSHHFSLPQGWEQRVENLLQAVGRCVAAASANAKQVGIPGHSCGTITLVNLRRAGIVLPQSLYNY